MEYPSKRRRITRPAVRYYNTDQDRKSSGSRQTSQRFSHHVEEVSFRYAQAVTAITTASVPKVNVKIRADRSSDMGKQAVEDRHHQLHRRQTIAGTGTSASSTLTVSVLTSKTTDSNITGATTQPIASSESAGQSSSTLSAVSTGTESVASTPPYTSTPTTPLSMSNVPSTSVRSGTGDLSAAAVANTNPVTSPLSSMSASSIPLSPSASAGTVSINVTEGTAPSASGVSGAVTASGSPSLGTQASSSVGSFASTAHSNLTTSSPTRVLSDARTPASSTFRSSSTPHSVSAFAIQSGVAFSSASGASYSFLTS
ncbi:hypothetical protein LTR28_009142, partial [Elasticomyces elasticus]